MPQGPPPGTFVGHGPIDLSKQTPPIHQPTHHSIPPGELKNLIEDSVASMALAGSELGASREAGT